MKPFKEFVRRTPVIREIMLFLFRLQSVLAYSYRQSRVMLSWLWRSKEYANFTYYFTDLNKRYLASVIAQAT
jgi:hypothetical protein